MIVRLVRVPGLALSLATVAICCAPHYALEGQDLTPEIAVVESSGGNPGADDFAADAGSTSPLGEPPDDGSVDSGDASLDAAAASSDAGLCTFRHNAAKPADVNGDGVVSPIDVLLIANASNRLLQGATLQQVCLEYSTRFLDANNDGTISSADSDVVVAVLNGGG